jgi:aminopeptidase
MADRWTRLADLAAHGANVQPGQIVLVQADLGHEELACAVAAAAYDRGAKFVDVNYFDPYVKRARIEHANPDTLEFVPSWYGDRFTEHAKEHGARVTLNGVTAPNLLDDLDKTLVGRDRLPRVKELSDIVGKRLTNWCIVPAPHPAWASLVWPELPEDEAYERLWSELEHVLRLDEPDANQAWDERMTVLRESASRHLPNLPTEEVFTTPDPLRTEGRVTSTKPLVLQDGTIVRGLRVRFEAGRAVEIDADENAEALRARLAVDEGGLRLGELALVDRKGRIGPLGTVFYDTLLDENAASHIALGSGFPFLVEEADAARVNESATHVDFMIGSPELEVDGVTGAGERTPILRDGDWQL